MLSKKAAIDKIVKYIVKRRLEEQANQSNSQLSNKTNRTYTSVETMKINIKELILAKAKTSEDREIFSHVRIARHWVPGENLTRHDNEEYFRR